MRTGPQHLAAVLTRDWVAQVVTARRRHLTPSYVARLFKDPVWFTAAEFVDLANGRHFRLTDLVSGSSVLLRDQTCSYDLVGRIVVHRDGTTMSVEFQ